MQSLTFRESEHRNVLNSYSMRVHFYYCVLVSLKIHIKQSKKPNSRASNNFLLKWLRNAQNNNIFHQDITSEIEWLRSKIIKSGPDTDLEPMLRYVYETAQRASVLKL